MLLFSGCKGSAGFKAGYQATFVLQSEDPSLERSFRGHKDAVMSVVFNPNMKQVVSSSLDGVVMVWNFKPQLRAFKFAGHKVGNIPTQGHLSFLL
jgi:WD40 repeat protein